MDHLSQQTQPLYKAYPDRLITSFLSSPEIASFQELPRAACLWSGLCSVIASQHSLAYTQNTQHVNSHLSESHFAS